MPGRLASNSMGIFMKFIDFRFRPCVKAVIDSIVNNPDFHFDVATLDFDSVYVDVTADRFQATVTAYNVAADGTRTVLDQFTRRLNERCSAEVKATRERVRTNSIYVSVCIGIIFIAVAASLLFANRAIATPLEETTKFAEYAAQGNLDASIAVSSSNEIGRLRKTLNFMIERLRFRIRESEEKQAHAEKQSREAQAARLRADEALGKANEAARQMHEAAERLADVARASEEVGRDLTARIEHSNAGAQEQAQRVAEATSAMEQMNLAVTDIAGNAAASSRGAQETRNAATAGVAVVEQVMESIQKVQDDSMELKSVMTALDRHAQDITRIMNVISDIADQTNLLALNAAIEAARAGEAGRGFAVVADEVRKLAEKTMASTSDVSSAITSIQESWNAAWKTSIKPRNSAQEPRPPCRKS